MAPLPRDYLLLSTSVLGLTFLFGGAPLILAPPAGALIWVVGRGATALSARLTTLLAALIALYPLYIAIIQISYWRSGQQGLDFGIFSQLIYQVAQNSRFVTSLISTEWQNFLTHHFSPYLMALGGVTKLGIPPEITLIGAHVVSVTALVWGIKKVWASAETPTHVLVLTATTLVLPGVRRALGWETHDEVLALPFIIWSLVAHLAGRNTLKLLLLFPPLLFKETFGLVMFVTALAYAINSAAGSRDADKVATRASLLVAAIGGAFFIVVMRVFPHWLWIPTFDPSARIASWSELFDGELLRQKVRWLALIFGPVIPFILLQTRRSLRISAVLIAPALYNIGAILITNFPPMMDPRNYYSVTPALLTFIAFAWPVTRHPRFSLATLLALALAMAGGETVRSSRIVKAGFSEPSAYAELRVFVPQQANVIADDYTTSVLVDNSRVMRIFHARQSRSSFDYIVVRRSLPDNLSGALKKRATICHETPRYTIWCAKK